MLIGGIPLLSRVVSATRHLGPVQVVGGNRRLLDLLENIAEVAHISDPTNDPGPFGAAVHALGHATGDEALIVSCDLAQLRSQDVDRLMSARRSTDADLAVPLVKGHRQWHGLMLASRIIPKLVASHAAGVRSLQRGFSGLRECAVVSADTAFFGDVDFPEDVAALETPL